MDKLHKSKAQTVQIWRIFCISDFTLPNDQTVFSLIILALCSFDFDSNMNHDLIETSRTVKETFNLHIMTGYFFSQVKI